MRKFIVLLALLCGTAHAADAPPPPDLQPLPDAGSSADAAPAEDAIEPQVTIIQRDKETIEEYRIHNQLYMIKVSPKNAKPYYLVDSDGDGKLDQRRNELDSKLLIPSWVVYTW